MKLVGGRILVWVNLVRARMVRRERSGENFNTVRYLEVGELQIAVWVFMLEKLLNAGLDHASRAQVAVLAGRPALPDPQRVVQESIMRVV